MPTGSPIADSASPLSTAQSQPAGEDDWPRFNETVDQFSLAD
jgi:hypothetical protein